jgi:hypothetical protein
MFHVPKGGTEHARGVITSQVVTGFGIVCECELEKLCVLSHRGAPKNAEREKGRPVLACGLVRMLHAPAPARGT